MMAADRQKMRVVHAVAAAVPVVLAGAAGSAATLKNIPTWYDHLAKPWFTPPNGVFGPAWTTLYILMAIAFYRVLGHPPGRARTQAIAIFLVHMALNAFWSVAFFGNRSPGLGVAELVLFWPAALANVVLFWRLDRVAGALMAPNLLWVTFAALLNIAVWRLN